MAITITEDIGDWSPQSVAASMKMAKASWAYGVQGMASAADFVNSLTYFFGTTSMTTSNGRLQRQVPVAHPVFPFWFVNSIASIKGVGPRTTAAAGGSGSTTFPGGGYTAPGNDSAVPVSQANPISSQWMLYQEYQYVIDFGPLPYAVISDDNIDVKQGSYYNESDVLTTFTYAEEWLRYTQWIPMPQFDNVTYQLGQMTFQTTGSPVPNCNNLAFQGYPRIYLPNQIIKFYWYGVPMRYLTSANSFLNLYVGRVNQNAWYNWGKATLLYLGYTPSPFAPPTPQAIKSINSRDAYSTERLVDLELTFLYTSRASTDAPTPTNRNHVAFGHNLLPWIDRKFHYARAKFGATVFPSWLSFPFELLFTDPDFIATP